MFHAWLDGWPDGYVLQQDLDDTPFTQDELRGGVYEHHRPFHGGSLRTRADRGEAIIELGLIMAMRMMVPAKLEVRCWHPNNHGVFPYSITSSIFREHNPSL